MGSNYFLLINDMCIILGASIYYFTETGCGGRSLLYRGFSYTKSKMASGGRILWTCSRKKSSKCKAVVYTLENGDNLTETRKKHNHFPILR